MATDTEICNLALGLLGERQISSLTEETKQARLCNRFFKHVFDQELRKHTWACVQKRATLARKTDQPLFQWTYAYELPTDFVRLTEFRNKNGYVTAQENFEREGDTILTHHETVNIIYVYRPTDASVLDPLAAQTLYYALAIAIAVPLTDDDTIKQNLVREYNSLIAPTARFVDSTERDVAPQEASGWVDSRWTSTNG